VPLTVGVLGESDMDMCHFVAHMSLTTTVRSVIKAKRDAGLLRNRKQTAESTLLCCEYSAGVLSALSIVLRAD